MHTFDPAASHLGIFPERAGDHQVGDGHHCHAEGKVSQVDVQHHPGPAATQAEMGQARPVAVRVRPHGEQGGHGKAGRPQQAGKGQRAWEGGSAVGLLAQHHSQSVQGDDGHSLQGHDDEARAGQVEGEAEALRDTAAVATTAGVQEEHQGEHGRGDAADEQVTEGQVEDHEVKVGAELAEHWVEEGQEDHQVAVGAQAEDEDQQEGAEGQGGRVDNGPARRPFCRRHSRRLGAVEALLPRRVRCRRCIHGRGSNVRT